MSVKEMACLYEICVLSDSSVIQYLLLRMLLKWPKQLNQNRKSLAALDWITFIALMSYLNSAFNCCSVQINMTDCVRLTKGGVSVVGGACKMWCHFIDSANGLFLDTAYELWDWKKERIDFYHYRVVVYTHCQHTFMFKRHIKVHFA